jgi:hypothetical protein
MVNKMKETGPAIFGEMVDEFKDWTNLEGIMGSKVVINGYRIGESNFNPGKAKAIVDFNFEDEPEHYGWSTESAAVLDTLEANQDNLPFECAVETRVSKKNGKSYPVLVGV